MCLKIGDTTAAGVVDHMKPHREDVDLFFDDTNLQSLCKACHDRHKQRQEKSGTLAGADVSGMPLDPAHRWNR